MTLTSAPRTRLTRLRGLAAVLATLLSCFAPRTFCGARPNKATLVGQKPPSDFFNQATISSNSHGDGDLTSLKAENGSGRDFGGHRSEGLFTAIVAALSTCAMSVLQAALRRTLWVPPFGAVALIFAAEAVDAAKEGTLLCRKTVCERAFKACAGVATACFCTVALAQLLGDTPTVMRTTVMFAAAFSMTLNPKAGYFPPAGALCALYVEKAVSKGVLPGFEYALFPCALGVGLLLIFTRLFTFLLAHPLWALRSSRSGQEKIKIAEA